MTGFLEVPQHFDFTHQTSHSSLSLHRKCPQAWFYRYGLKLKRDEDVLVPALTLGRWWSALRSAEALERGRKLGTLVPELVPSTLEPEDDPKFAVKSATANVEVVVSMAKRWWGSITHEEQEAFTETFGQPLADRLLGMFLLWDEAAQDRHAYEEPLGVEVYWERTLPMNPDNRIWKSLAKEGDVPAMKIVGYVDEIYRDMKRGGMTVIRDYKATKRVAVSSLDDLMDSQLQFYVWGSAPLLKEKGIPAVRAVGFDRTQTAPPTEPKLTLGGNLSKQVTNYPLATYIEWANQNTVPTLEEREALVAELGLKDEDQIKAILGLPEGRLWGDLGKFYVSGVKKGKPKFGVYTLEEKEVQRLSQPATKEHWTSKTLTPVNKYTVRAHLQSAVDSALDIWLTQSRANRLGEASRNLTRFGCQMCEFQDICRAQIVGGPRGQYDLGDYRLQQNLPQK